VPYVSGIRRNDMTMPERPTRGRIADMRSAIYRTEHDGAPPRVFAQITAEGEWRQVYELKVVRKIIWVKLAPTGGSYMAWDVKLVE
jgi:hypothetical protein